MKNLFKSQNLPLLTAALGGIGLLMRRMLYAVAVDEKSLLPMNHPLELLLAALTAAVLVLIALAAWKLDGSDEYGDNFRPSMAAAVGHICVAVGILMTVLLQGPVMSGYLGTIWQYLGYSTPVCLVAAGYLRMQGKQPFFLLHMVPCLFLVFHIVNHYQVWSGNPQLQDYVFELFGLMSLMLFGFYSAAFDAGAGRRRMHLVMGLAALYLCIVTLSGTDYPVLFLSGAVWALTGLCSMTPKPKPEPEPEEQERE